MIMDIRWLEGIKHDAHLARRCLARRCKALRVEARRGREYAEGKPDDAHIIWRNLD